MTGNLSFHSWSYFVFACEIRRFSTPDVIYTQQRTARLWTMGWRCPRWCIQVGSVPLNPSLLLQHAITQARGHGRRCSSVAFWAISNTAEHCKVLKCTLSAHLEYYGARLNGNFDPPVRRYKLFLLREINALLQHFLPSLHLNVNQRRGAAAGEIGH